MTRARLDRERWLSLRSLFDEVCELPPADQVERIRRADLDPVVHRELAELLAHADAAGEFLEQPVASELYHRLDRDLSGQRLGAYQLEEKIGQGGMSVVYAARRADATYEQRVAVKLLKRGLDERAWRQRFHVERQILARLQHPNIARLLDGGTTADGVPYAVMELVDGEKIDDYCRRLRLPIPARLQLFRDVCEAVQFAHRNLVVHRDLKPGNILITRDSEPRLLDFGIAKLLDEPFDGRPHTATGVRIYTPGFASPEQLRGDPITTASDVYSLGVLLYRLLANAWPVDPDEDLERGIHESVPAPPSAALVDIEAAGLRGRLDVLRRVLKGDLDAICLRAVRADPTHRYESVDRLIEDLDRFDRGEPVTARRGTVAYRAGKWLRRNRIALAVASLFVVAVLTFSALTLRQARQVADERDLARQGESKARETLDFLVRLFRETDPDGVEASALTIPDLLDRGGAQARSRLAEKPELGMPLLRVLADVNHQMGRYTEALTLRREELSLRRRDASELELIDTLTRLGHTYLNSSQFRSAHAAYLEATVRAEQALDPEHPQRVEGQIGLGLIAHKRGDFDTAAHMLRSALETLRRADPPRPMKVAENLYNLALLERDAGRLRAAESLLEEALEIERELRTESDTPHPRAGSTMMSLSSVRARLGDLDQAATLGDEALRILRATLPADHPMIRFGLAHRGSVARRQGDLPLAEKLLRQVLAFDGPPFGDETADRASALNNLGIVLREQGDFAGAEEATRKALSIYRSVHPDGHPNIAVALSNLGLYRARQGDAEGARRLYAEAMSQGRAIFGPDHPSLAYTALRWGRLELDEGDPQAAEPRLRRALDLRRRGLEPGHPLTAQALADLGRCLRMMGRHDEAERALVENHRIVLDHFGPEHPDTERAQRLLDEHRGDRGDPAADPDRSSGHRFDS